MFIADIRVGGGRALLFGPMAAMATQNTTVVDYDLID